MESNQLSVLRRIIPLAMAPSTKFGSKTVGYTTYDDVVDRHGLDHCAVGHGTLDLGAMDLCRALAQLRKDGFLTLDNGGDNGFYHITLTPAVLAFLSGDLDSILPKETN